MFEIFKSKLQLIKEKEELIEKLKVEKEENAIISGIKSGLNIEIGDEILYGVTKEGGKCKKGKVFTIYISETGIEVIGIEDENLDNYLFKLEDINLIKKNKNV